MANMSPFLGMDPFTETNHIWAGIHTQLIGDLSINQLPQLILPTYHVDVEPSLQICTDDNLEDERAESAIFIREVGTERLVTVIEILSYSNKTKGKKKYDQYIKKRQEFLNSGIHLVEVDLLRWGDRVVDKLPDQPYHILVSRGDEQPKGRVWSFGFQEPIPTVPLPLVEPDEYVPLLLQESFQKIYQARNFRQRLNYLSDPTPPLTEAQRLTIHKQLMQAGIRVGEHGQTNGTRNDNNSTKTGS